MFVKYDHSATAVVNRLWLTGITEFRIPARKAYLSPVIDCYNGMVVAYSAFTSPNTELENSMLRSAALRLIIESVDRGEPCPNLWMRWKKTSTPAFSAHPPRLPDYDSLVIQNNSKAKIYRTALPKDACCALRAARPRRRRSRSPSFPNISNT